MTRGNLILSAVGAVALLLACGCSKESAVTTSELEKVFEVSPAPAKPAEPTPAEAAPSTAEGASVSVESHVRRAIVAIRSNEYEEAVVLLNALRSASSLSPDQLTAVQDTMGNLQTRLAELAERGDPKARQALESLRQMKRR